MPLQVGGRGYHVLIMRRGYKGTSPGGGTCVNKAS
jgi:hypothetical protein